MSQNRWLHSRKRPSSETRAIPTAAFSKMARKRTSPSRPGSMACCIKHLRSLNGVTFYVSSNSKTRSCGFGAPDFGNRIDSFLLRLVIGAGQHFADEPDRDELNSTNDEQNSRQEQRSVFLHHVYIENEFANQKEDCGYSSCTCAQQSPSPKELKRPRGVIEQKFDADQIQQHCDRARQSVIRFTAAAREVLDRNFRDRRTRPAGECRNKPMQLSVELQLFDHLATISLECRPEVMQLQTTQFRHQPICDAAGKSSRDPSILPLITPAADNVVAFAEFRDECRDLGGIVLEIAVHRNDDFTAREVEPSLQSGSLSKVLAQTDNGDARVRIGNFRKNLGCLIAASIVHENDFIITVEFRHRCHDAGIQRTDVVFLVIKRN